MNPSRSSPHKWQSIKAYSSIIHKDILGLCPSRICDAWAWWVNLGLRGPIEVTYMLGGGFLSRVVGCTKALPVYLMEEGWCQDLHLDSFLQVMHDQFTQFLLLCPFMGFPQGYLLPIGPMMTSHRFLPRPRLLQVSHPINIVLTQTPFCACVIHLGQGYPSLHSSFSF